MCGIAGILVREGAGEAARLGPMLAAQRHRGPDGEGSRVSGPLALGAVRLAVLDRSALAQQPMASPDGRFLLAYNGEVYNRRDLREDLEREGEAFRSPGDTEVVLKALSRWGAPAVERMNGVFALAFWDAREGRLLLARDRVGVRPLYWAEAGGAVLFASEIKGILASGLLRAGIDGAALAELFRFQNVWSERTLFSGILPVPPGTCLSFQGGKVERRTWWRFSFPGDLKVEAVEAATELSERLGKAVRRQIGSEVPVGAALSGGLDGAAVALEASRWIPHLPTFTIGFEDASVPGDRAVDERPAARSVAKALGAVFHEEILSPGEALKDLRTLLWHLEEPRLAASFQNLSAARLARRHATVVLSGGGGDELFAGYPWRYAEGPAKAWTRILAGDAFWTREGLGRVSEGDPEGVLRSLEAGAEGSALHRMMAVEARTFLPAYCVLEDKLHMAFGAEVRVPFLDHDLVDWAVRLPESLRLSPDGRTGKVLLRDALSGKIPAPVVEGAKQGFVPPLLSWASREPWSSFLEGTLLGRDRGLIRPDAMKKDLEALKAGDPRPLQRVWTSLAFELWCRLFLDGETP